MENRLLNMLYFILQEIIEEDMDIIDDEDEIRTTLLAEGYQEEEIDVALGWLESYFRAIPQQLDTPSLLKISPAPRSLRVLSFDEKLLIAPEAYGYLVSLESKGLIAAETKEEIIHRSMGMFEELIGVEEIKIVTLLTIFEQGHNNLDDLINLVNGHDLKSMH